MFTSESLSPPPRGGMRVNINDLLNPVRPSDYQPGSPANGHRFPSATVPAAAGAHTPVLPGIDKLTDNPYDRHANSRSGSRPEQDTRTEQDLARRMHEQHLADARQDQDASQTIRDEQAAAAAFNPRSAHWLSSTTSRKPYPTLPPLQPVHDLKSDPWQKAPFSASPRERHQFRDESSNRRSSLSDTSRNGSAYRPTVLPPSPSTTSSSASPQVSPVATFAPSRLSAAPSHTMAAIPQSAYGHQQHKPQQANCPPPPAMFGPQAYAHHPHLGGRSHLVPLVKPVQSPVMLSPVTPPKNEMNASPTVMGVDALSNSAQPGTSASVCVTARGSEPPTPSSARDEPEFVLQLHPTEQPQQNARQRKRTHSKVDLRGEGASSPAPRSSSISSMSSYDSAFNGCGGDPLRDGPKTKKVRERSQIGGPDMGPSVSSEGLKASKKQSGSEDTANGSAKPSRKGKEKDKEKSASAPSHGYGNGQLQPLDPQMTMRLGYGVGVVPVREGVPLFPFGYAPYPVPMHMHPLGIPVAVPAPHNQPLNGKWFPELQYARCMSARYKADPFPRCVSCTRRWAGDTCRFQNIRILLRDSNKTLWAVGFQDLNAKTHGPQMVYPDQWNVKLQKTHVDRTMKTVASYLLPHLQKEQAHQQLGSVVKRQRETDVRATCDTCMTSLFSSSWMCRQCGREACEECFDTIRRLTSEQPPTANTTPNAKGKGSASGADQRTMKERHAQSNPFFLSCNRKAEHGVHTFVPVTRFVKTELDNAVAEMERLVYGTERRLMGSERCEPESPGRNPEHRRATDDSVDMEVDASQEATRSRSETEARGAKGEPIDITDDGVNQQNKLTPEYYDDGVCTLVKNPIPPQGSSASSSSQYLPPSSEAPQGTPTWPVPYYSKESLTESVFASQWARGTPLVVTGLLDRLKLNWSPDYFMRAYGQQPCIILECQTDANKKVTVSEFFNCFGRYEGRTECWKLKDWPPSTDFKTAFPELYDDFNRAVPVPSYTRRDGAYNIASHFPTNTIVPDLGPKMYNAYASFDGPGSKGSTRLHMDMADAVNIMLHAEKTPDGAPGCAAWDIFRAEDSVHLRNFFRKNFKGQYQNDPIHAQHFYLDAKLRTQLFEEFGVRPFRIYQRPGEAVFIPAGCAHQVCNFSDCIKAACDFVSPENVERCEALTREFRAQNQSLVWKEDVLQLRSMMWFAWLSCRQQEQKWKDEERRQSDAAAFAESSQSNMARGKDGMDAVMMDASKNGSDRLN